MGGVEADQGNSQTVGFDVRHKRDLLRFSSVVVEQAVRMTLANFNGIGFRTDVTCMIYQAANRLSFSDFKKQSQGTHVYSPQS